MNIKDYTLDALLEMDGEIYFYPNGYWYKIEARRLISVDNSFPAGIKYSLTFHASDGKQLLGYDNAHAINGSKFDEPFDHIHKGERVVKYSYSGAIQLLSDFFRDIDRILEFKREYEHEI